MASFNRLLILAALALAASIHSSPVGTDSGHSIEPTESGLMPARSIDQGTVVPTPSANDVEEGADLHDEGAPSILEQRATRTTKPAPKPKTTKVKTTVKATRKGPTKTTMVTATKSTKTAKATTKPTGTATPSACPIKKPAKKSRALITRAYDYIARLFEQDNAEFVGWHGTNSETAVTWASAGHIVKPGSVETQGGKKGTKGASGADAELGPGLYVTDDRELGIAFAIGNSQFNKGTAPALCAIYAKSSQNWRIAIRKAFIETALVGPSREKKRIEHIKQAVPGVHAESVVKFALLDLREGKPNTGQMVLPELIESHFTSKCFKVDVNVGGVAESDAAASTVGTNSFPQFSYNGATLRQEWNIAPENAGTCN
ncbi:hypothetical protein V8D89_004863 [Ganoderma adspersum]